MHLSDPSQHIHVVNSLFRMMTRKCLNRPYQSPCAFLSFDFCRLETDHAQQRKWAPEVFGALKMR